MNRDKTAIILVNYNSLEDTRECLKSLEQLEGHWKVFVVDNDSSDSSSVALKTFLDGWNRENKLILSKSNLGFAGGNNLAIKAAEMEGYESFWLLNNDTLVESDSLTALIECSRKFPHSVVGSRILYESDRDIIWFAGGFINPWTGNAEIRGLDETNSDSYDDDCLCEYITGCSLFFTREALELCGYLPEDYFLYYEETDWCFRLARAGYSFRVASSSIVYHKVGRSSNGYASPWVAYYNLRNRFVFMWRNFRGMHRFTALLFLFYKALKLSINLIRLRKDRKRDRYYAILRAVLHSLTGRMGPYTFN